MKFKDFLFKFVITFMKFIPSGLPLIILRGPLKGYKLIIGAPAGSGKGISFLFNLSEPERLKMVKNLISKNFVCFDIGASIGFYSLLFSRYSKLVYAFEPLPSNLNLLQKMLRLNKVKNVIIIPSAVADKNGESMFKAASNVAEGKLDASGTQKVSTISLDSFITKKKVMPNLLNIDVEGAELLVLDGAKNFLSKNKPIIVMETHGHLIKEKCFTFLKQIGYASFNPIGSDSIKVANDFIIKP
ncbi:MAG: FkbM family methyltransferase [Candidatus Odinarchaeota archaeon]